MQQILYMPFCREGIPEREGDQLHIEPETHLLDIEKGGLWVQMDQIEGYALRHSVRPGLTGLAQVYAARDIHHRHKFKYDLLYIKRMSFWLDMKLIAVSFRNTFTAKWHV